MTKIDTLEHKLDLLLELETHGYTKAMRKKTGADKGYLTSKKDSDILKEREILRKKIADLKK
jgi:hypothetical protein